MLQQEDTGNKMTNNVTNGKEYDVTTKGPAAPFQFISCEMIITFIGQRATVSQCIIWCHESSLSRLVEPSSALVMTQPIISL